MVGGHTLNDCATGLIGYGRRGKTKAEVGNNAQKDELLNEMGVQISDYGVRKVEMENTIFEGVDSDLYDRGSDGIIRKAVLNTNGKPQVDANGNIIREKIGGVTISNSGWFPRSTICMSPFNTKANFTIALNHEFIHAYQWVNLGWRMSSKEWKSYTEASAYSYTNRFFNGFQNIINSYRGSYNLYNWPKLPNPY